MSVHTAKGLWSHLASDCGLRDHISKVFTMHLGGIHTCICLLVIRSLWTDENTTSEVCERRPGHVGQRESERTGTGEWYDTKCSIERYEKSIFSPALRTSSGLFFSSQCSLQMRRPHVALLNLTVSVELTLPRQLFFPPPLHKPRRSTLTDRDTLWQQSTSGRICKAHRVVCMSKKKKSLCLFHEDA